MIAPLNPEETNVPPIYRVTNYRLSQMNRIEKWTYVSWNGRKSKPVHEGIPEVMFLGFAIVMKGARRTEVTFPLPAASIQEAALVFDKCLNSVLAEMNKPNIITP